MRARRKEYLYASALHSENNNRGTGRRIDGGKDSGGDSDIRHPHFPQPLISSSIPPTPPDSERVAEVMGHIFAFSSSGRNTQHITDSFILLEFLSPLE